MIEFAQVQAAADLLGLQKYGLVRIDIDAQRRTVSTERLILDERGVPLLNERGEQMRYSTLYRVVDDHDDERSTARPMRPVGAFLCCTD